MTPRELSELIIFGESSTLEFKRKFTTEEKFAKEISSFANTKGGKLLVGVEDNGTIYGIESEKTDMDLIDSVCVFHIFPEIIPDIEFVSVKNKLVLIINIKESKQKPHTVLIKDDNTEKFVHRAYIRVGEQSIMASREMFRLMKNQSKSNPLKLSIGNETRLGAGP